MSVKLCYRAALEELTGRREEYIEARAVSKALSHIKRRYSRAAYREARRMLIAVNGESIQLRGRLCRPPAGRRHTELPALLRREKEENMTGADKLKLAYYPELSGRFQRRRALHGLAQAGAHNGSGQHCGHPLPAGGGGGPSPAAGDRPEHSQNHRQEDNVHPRRGGL